MGLKTRFGDVFGMDYEPKMRLMALCQAPGEWLRETWQALVLTDEGGSRHSWLTGEVVTMSPSGSGVVSYGNVLEERT